VSAPGGEENNGQRAVIRNTCGSVALIVSFGGVGEPLLFVYNPVHGRGLLRDNAGTNSMCSVKAVHTEVFLPTSRP